jgi:hypothetical protein
MKQVANRFEQTRSSLRDTCMAAGPTWGSPEERERERQVAKAFHPIR